MIDYWLLYNNKNLNHYSNSEEFVEYGILCFETSSTLNYAIPGICITNQVLFAIHNCQTLCHMAKVLYLFHTAL